VQREFGMRRCASRITLHVREHDPLRASTTRIAGALLPISGLRRLVCELRARL
jgi:hypothetical protein